jgi:hypothetical protein
VTTQEHLSSRIRSLENELKAALEEKEKAFQYRWVSGKVRFEPAVLSEHHRLKHWLPSYLLDSDILAWLTAPIIYAGVLPFCLLDFFLWVYQGICFPVYRVPKAKRSDYIVFDRSRLKYLNLLERLNCAYCSYGNGVLAYGAEIAARTEQHWCPIKHAARLRAPHSRYGHFLEYGDARQYRQEVETVRNDFVDLNSLTSKTKPPSQSR